MVVSYGLMAILSILRIFFKFPADFTYELFLELETDYDYDLKLIKISVFIVLLLLSLFWRISLGDNKYKVIFFLCVFYYFLI